MQWNTEPYAGFSPPETAATWLPVADDYKQVNVQRELDDPASFLNLYRRLLSYRRMSPALRWGSYAAVDGVPDDCYVYLRAGEGQQLLIALNFAAAPRRLDLSAFGEGEIVISTHMDRDEILGLSGLILREHEGVVVELLG